MSCTGKKINQARISRKKEADKKYKKKESDKNSKKNKNQARKQEHKNLVWRDKSCLARQDSVYKNLDRRSRSVFPGKILV